jgi:hypothetical protein
MGYRRAEVVISERLGVNKEDRFSAQNPGENYQLESHVRVKCSSRGRVVASFPCIKACGLMSWLLGSKGTSAPLKWAGQTELLQVLWLGWRTS